MTATSIRRRHDLILLPIKALTAATAIALSFSRPASALSTGNSLPDDILRAVTGRSTAAASAPSNTPATALSPAYTLRPLLLPSDRSRNADAPDEFFYDAPTLVQHNDDAFRSRLSDMYAEALPEAGGGTFLDVGSSWVSHLPTEVRPREVWLHGMNREELERNPDGTGYRIVRSFNKVENDAVNEALLASSKVRISVESELLLPEIPSNSVDVIGACATFQYWRFPERVTAEILRILKPGGRCIVSFSDRMFSSKAVGAWMLRSSGGRVRYVSDVLENGVVGDDGSRLVVTKTVEEGAFMAALAMPLSVALGRRVGGTDPFLAVVACKETP